MSSEQKKYALECVEKIYDEKFKKIYGKYTIEYLDALRTKACQELIFRADELKNRIEFDEVDCLSKLLTAFRKEEF